MAKHLPCILYSLLQAAIENFLVIQVTKSQSEMCNSLTVYTSEKVGKAKDFEILLVNSLQLKSLVKQLLWWQKGGGDKYTVPGKELLKRKAMGFEARGGSGTTTAEHQKWNHTYTLPANDHDSKQRCWKSTRITTNMQSVLMASSWELYKDPLSLWKLPVQDDISSGLFVF